MKSRTVFLGGFTLRWRISGPFFVALVVGMVAPSLAFTTVPLHHGYSHCSGKLSRETTATKSTTQEDINAIQNKPQFSVAGGDNNNNNNNLPPPVLEEEAEFQEIGPTSQNPKPRPLTEKLRQAVLSNQHPQETPEELGRGTYITADWRRAWYTYGSLPPNMKGIINPETGEASYDIDEIEGTIPNDLQGVLYRNGAGKLGVNGERVQHVLDADGLVFQIYFHPPDADASKKKRKVTFR